MRECDYLFSIKDEKLAPIDQEGCADVLMRGGSVDGVTGDAVRRD